MKTFKTFSIFVLAVAASFVFSKQFVRISAADKDDFTIQRFDTHDKTPMIKIENLLLDKYDPVGKIVGAFKPQNKLTNDDVIYLSFTSGAVSVGDRFLIYKDRGSVKEPGKIFSSVGHNIEYKGAVQITSVLPESTVGKIFDASLDIEVGDSLAPFKDLTMKLTAQDPVADVKGRVMGSPKGLELIGAFEFAYVNLGSRDGVRMGDRLYAYMTGDGNREITKGLPEVNMAELVIVDLQEKFSTAYVLSAVDRVETGTAVKTAVPLVKYLNSAAPAQSKSSLPNQ